MLRQILSLIMIGVMIELAVADGVINRGLESKWILAPLFILGIAIIIVGTLEQRYSGEDRNEP